MAILYLDSADDSRLDVFARLTEHQLRHTTEIESGICIVESEIALRVALKQNLKPISFLISESKISALSDIIDKLDDDVNVFVLSAQEAQKLTGYRVTRGVLAAFERPCPKTLDEALKDASRVCVLEGLVDTSNVGAIFRNAAALGIDSVVVAPTCADPLCRRSIRVSMGTIFQIPFARPSHRWPYCLFEKLHEYGFYSIGMALEKESKDLDDPGLKEHDKLALFFGCEGTGLRHNTLEACDATVMIPMAHEVDSLNVAASTAVTFWELNKDKQEG